MKILVLGGDGYLGWPTAMHFSKAGHEVMAVDNYMRRRVCRETNSEPLFEVPNLIKRAELWKELSGLTIKTAIGDLIDWSFIEEIFTAFCPDTLIHYAEQPSAPYSMRDRRAAALTLNNNLSVTFNAIHAVRQFCPSCHIVKLGTMGEYGTPNIDIEEGWLEIDHNGRKDKFLFPRQGGSLYHITKIMDTDMLWFYVRMWNLQVTDIMQGPVYGVETNETGKDARLYPFLNYDEIFGTVINRFLVQAVCGHPLTVYGKGGQTRGYLNIKDTLNCVALIVNNPPGIGKLRVLNQFTELFNINGLAEKVRSVGNSMGLNVEIKSVENPRKEAEEHYYNPKHSGLTELGFKPTYLTDDVLAGLLETILRFKDKIDPSKFIKNIRWS